MAAMAPDLAEPQPIEALVLQVGVEPGGRARRDEVCAVGLLLVLEVVPAVGGGVAGGHPGEVLEEGGPFHAGHVLGAQDGVLAVEEPDRRHVGLPPDGLGGVGLVAHEDLGGHDAALVVDAHEESQDGVEDDPGAHPYLHVSVVLGQVDRREE